MRPLSLALLAVPVLGGCFTYQPIEPSAVAPGMSVRVRVTEEESRRMEATRDPDDPFEGTVFEVDGTQFSLLPELGPAAATELLSLRFGDIRTLEQRQLSKTKTWVVIGAGMGAGILMVLAAEGVLLGGAGPGGPGDFSIIAVLRLPLGP